MKHKVKYALGVVLGVAENAKCEDLHHKKSQYHEAGEACPVEADIAYCCQVIKDEAKKLYS